MQIVKKADGYDLRLYEAFPVVTMSYENRAEGYGSLGNYIGACVLCMYVCLANILRRK